MAPVPPPSLLSRVMFQWKRGWNEIPEVMGAGVIGTGSVAALIYMYFTTPAENLVSRYKYSYYVFRPDDPRLAGVKRFENSPEVTFGGPEKPYPC